MAFLNRCIWTAASSGLGDFGDGTYNTGTGTLARTTVRNSSNSDAKVNFSAAPAVTMGGPVARDMPQTAGQFFAEASETAILNAASLANSFGGGTVKIAPGRTTMTQGLPPYPYVRYDGAAWGSDNRSNKTVGAGGTILVGNSGIRGYAYHDTDLSVAPTDFSTFVDGMLVGAGVSNITFEGYEYGVKIGAKYNPGMQSCFFDNLNFVSCTVADFYVENYWCCEFEHIHSQASGTYSIVAVASGATALNCGNSMWKYPSININAYTTRGLCFWSRNGSELNQDNVYSPESQSNHGTTISQAASMSNGSANIGVTDSTKFPVGMPVTFSGSVNGFIGATATPTVNQTYFVLTSAANVITVGLTTFGSAVSATGNTAVNVRSMGYSLLEMSAQDSGSSLTAINAYSPDLEGNATARVLLQNASFAEISGGYVGANTGTNEYATFVLRGSVRTFIRSMRVYTVDADSGSNAILLGDTTATGQVYNLQNFRGGLRIDSGQTVNFADQAYLSTPGANALALVNGTSPQNFQAYNTFTSSTVGEWLRFGWNGSNEAIFGTDKGSGGGSVRGVRVMVGGTNIADLGISVSGSFTFTNAVYSGGGVFANSVSPTAHGLSGLGITTNAKIYLDQTSGILFLWNATGANYGSISINGANLWGLGSSSAGSTQSTNSLQWDGSNNVILGNGPGASLAACSISARLTRQRLMQPRRQSDWTSPKDPNEVKDYEIDWSDLLDTDTIRRRPGLSLPGSPKTATATRPRPRRSGYRAGPPGHRICSLTASRPRAGEPTIGRSS
jgi:hypothetical protein